MAIPIISRAQAEAEGLARYFTGKPCAYGHVAERQVSDYRCVECNRRRCLRRYHRDLGESRRKAKERYDANPKAWLLRAFHWRSRNPEKFAAVGARWQRLNPEKVCAYSANRRARKRGAEGLFTEDDILDIYRLQDGRCACCGEDLSHKYEIDHVVPLSMCGTNWPNNLQLLCRSCNGQKGSKHPGDFCRDYRERHGVWPLFAARWGFAS